MFCWFYAVTLLPLAEAVSLNFTVPLFATAGAALALREPLRIVCRTDFPKRCFRYSFETTPCNRRFPQ